MRQLSLAVGLLFVLPAFAQVQVSSTNFVVTAPNARLAQEFAQAAETFRKQKALEWLGQEMPKWPQPCPLDVRVKLEGASGATHFNFMGQTYSQRMEIEGSYERLLHSVLPHEITHTVFAHYFRCPVPRWADEGGSVLSEDDTERHRHDSMCRQHLREGRAMKLRSLLGLKDYPRDVGVLYAEGFSVTQFLVERHGRPAFLQFIAHGMQHGWDPALQTHYQLRSIEDLETAWIDHMKNPVAKAQPQPGAGLQSGSARITTWQTTPPAQPQLDPPPTARGQSPQSPAEQAPFQPTAHRPSVPPPPLSGTHRPVRLGLPEPR